MCFSTPAPRPAVTVRGAERCGLDVLVERSLRNDELAPMTDEPHPASPLELLFEAGGLPAFPLPDELASVYGGTLGFEGPRLLANFVSTLDGVVALRSMPRSSRVVGGGTSADRFVMALLRACADALIMGASTVRHSSEGSWTAQRLFPPAAAGFTELRRRLGLAESPDLAIVTRSGEVDPAHPALEAGALVMTTEHGARVLEGRLPPASSLEVFGTDDVDTRAAVAALHARGHQLILSEGGPTMLGSLLDEGLVDELFLTVAPLLAGRDDPAARLALVEGVELLPERRVEARLLGARRDGEYLLLRYGLVRARAG
jgi:riboflavin biosynthesis pyrimidine reductase